MDALISFIKNELFPKDNPVLLHRPVFDGNEKNYLAECIDSNFVSSVGQRVTDFENMICDYTGAGYAIAVVNGTAALHVALLLAGADSESEVLTQPLTFAATCNAVKYCGADPIFIDVDLRTLGISAEKLEVFLETEISLKNGRAVNRRTGKKIAACVPMHTFGHPCEIEDITRVCEKYEIPLVEDAAESLGSTYRGRHTGTFGKMGIISFNGNKIITTGGGGMIITDDKNIAERAKFLTTTGKTPHPYEYFHPELAYNYRLPNLNAALGCAQMEHLERYVNVKRRLAGRYRDFCDEHKIGYISEPEGAQSNYWLNAIKLSGRIERDEFLSISNSRGVMTRPVWELMNRLPAFSNAQHGNLDNAESLADCLVNLPSSVPTM